jgi:hypothetical protein
MFVMYTRCYIINGKSCQVRMKFFADEFCEHRECAQPALPTDTAPLRFAAQVKRRPLDTIQGEMRHVDYSQLPWYYTWSNALPLFPALRRLH